MINDSQHRHTVQPQMQDIEIDDDDSGGPEALATHLLCGECPNAPELTADTQCPMTFVVEDPGGNRATVTCGFCHKKMGTCKIKYPGMK